MSLAVDTTGMVPDEVVTWLRLPIERLRLTEGVRSGGLDEAQVTLLMETVDEWPPIVVWGDECLVVDGAHRVVASRRLGRSTVAAVRDSSAPATRADLRQLPPQHST